MKKYDAIIIGFGKGGKTQSGYAGNEDDYGGTFVPGGIGHKSKVYTFDFHTLHQLAAEMKSGSGSWKQRK